MKIAFFSLVFSTGFFLAGCSSYDAPPAPAPPALQIGIYDATVVEGTNALEFVVSLSSPATEIVSVDYATDDGSAIAGSDYAATLGNIEFAAGETRKFVQVKVLNNPAPATATSKYMQLTLSNAQHAALNTSEFIATGTIIDSDSDVLFPDTAFNQNWRPVGVFSGAALCADCHASDDDDGIMQYDNTDVSLSSDDISPSAQWPHTVKANAFNDPYWQAAVEDEVDSLPHLAGFIEDTCNTCHAPMGRSHAHHLNPEVEYSFATAKTENHAREGVSCTLCHQMQDNGADSGGYTISDDVDNKMIFGPYATPKAKTMRNSTGYTPVNGEHVQASKFCGRCHTLYTPVINPETGLPSGPDTGLPSATKGFLEQGPNLEWQNSIYAAGVDPVDCQDCHMPVPSESYETAISTRPSKVPRRSPYGQHTLVGGNAHLLTILREYRAELGISGSTTRDGFNDQIAHTRHFLQSAATLAVSAPVTAGSTLEFDVEISNFSGHKLPTSYPSRRTWLHVVVRNAANKIIFESGKPDARGYLTTDTQRLKADCMAGHKLEGFDSANCYEPHRNVIDDPAQIAIYETVMGDINGDITHTLLQGAQYLKDNRIPPLGFSNSLAASIELQTVPAGVAGDDDFNCVSFDEGCGTDSVRYQVNIEGQTGPYTVESRLLYQATQPGFVDGMHNTGDRVNRFKAMYVAVPPAVEVLATATSP